MKNIKLIIAGSLLAAGIVTGCGRNNNQSEGAADPTEANNTNGSENSESDMGSGGTVDTTASGTPQDTVQGTTTNGNKDI